MHKYAFARRTKPKIMLCYRKMQTVTSAETVVVLLVMSFVLQNIFKKEIFRRNLFINIGFSTDIIPVQSASCALRCSFNSFFHFISQPDCLISRGLTLETQKWSKVATGQWAHRKSRGNYIKTMTCLAKIKVATHGSYKTKIRKSKCNNLEPLFK